MWNNFKKMPKLLKILTVHALGMFALFIGSVIPHGFFVINERAVSYAEWWGSGAGILASIIGILLPISGYLFLKRNVYARIVYILAVIIIFFSEAVIFGTDREAVIPFIIVVLILAGLISAYLYRSKSVNLYFTP